MNRIIEDPNKYRNCPSGYIEIVEVSHSKVIYYHLSQCKQRLTSLFYTMSKEKFEKKYSITI